jgi:hypothetical protein
MPAIGLLVGVVLGVLIAGSTIAGSTYIVRRRRRTRAHDLEQAQHSEDTQGIALRDLNSSRTHRSWAREHIASVAGSFSRPQPTMQQVIRGTGGGFVDYSAPGTGTSTRRLESNDTSHPDSSVRYTASGVSNPSTYPNPWTQAPSNTSIPAPERAYTSANPGRYTSTQAPLRRQAPAELPSGELEDVNLTTELPRAQNRFSLASEDESESEQNGFDSQDLRSNVRDFYGSSGGRSIVRGRAAPSWITVGRDESFNGRETV